MGIPFAGLVIKSVLTCYAVWGAVVVSDLALCEARKPGTCESQRAEVRGAAASIPGTLLAWLADSPLVASQGQRVNGLNKKNTTQLDQ